MSFAYPIYEDKTNKDSVRFYHCSDKKSKVRTLKTNYTCGSILDRDQNLVFSPLYKIVPSVETNDSVKLEMIDGTVVHMYYIDSRWYLGTKNSWDITGLYDISSTTYGEFFAESLKNYPNFAFSKLDKTCMYTVLFTNPKCHLLSNDYKVYVYSKTDKLSDVFDVLSTTDNEDDYITVSQTLVDNQYELSIHQSNIRFTTMGLLYGDRRKTYAKTTELSFAKAFISAMCHCKRANRTQVVEYLLDHIGDIGKKVFEDIGKVAAKFEEENVVIDEFLGESIPVDLLCQSHESTLYCPENIGFFIRIYRAFAQPRIPVDGTPTESN